MNIKTQRARPHNVAKGLELRKMRGAEIRNGGLDAGGGIYFTDEKVSSS